MSELNMRPADFWSLSATEWRWLAGSTAGAEPRLSLSDARRLACLYPDEKP